MKPVAVLMALLLVGALAYTHFVDGSAAGARPDPRAGAAPASSEAAPPSAAAAAGRRSATHPTTAVSALGRLEPQRGVVRIAGPSDLVVVVKELFVDRGDRLRPGQLVATLDTLDVATAEVEVAKHEIDRVEAELANARREMRRSTELNRDAVVPDADREQWESEVDMLEAELGSARAKLARAEAGVERSRVYAPFAGQVLQIHAWPGERVGEGGILEVARTQRMVAVAEVYETDIGRVRLGQRATVTSPALPHPLAGTVDWIALKVAKQDAVGTDPAARKDARVVEVEIGLDDSEAAAGLTNLQVEILIEPGAERASD